jgi:putative peptidoglycan lipid II flippase
LGKAIGFLIPFFIAAWFGITNETDAFFFAYGLIFLLATIFSPVAESIMVPFIADAIVKGEDVGAFVGRILGMSAIGLAVISGLFLLIIRPVLSVITNFSSQGLNLVYRILLESAPLIVLLAWTSILAGTLNAYKVFGIPAISPAFRAVATLTFIFAFKDNLGVHAIAWGYVLGEIFRLVVLFAIMGRLNIFNFKLSLGWDSKFADFLKTSSYQIIGMSMLVFTSIINKTMASWLGPGKVSILEYAERLYMIPITLLSSGLVVTLLSHWSERYYREGAERLKKDVLKTAKVTGALALLLTVFLFLIKDYMARMVYGHGKFPEEQIKNVGAILGFYLLGITPYFLSQVYVRAFLTQKDTKILLLTALPIFIGTIVFNLIFMRIMGIVGIAMANSMVVALAFGPLVYLFHRKNSGKAIARGVKK